MINRSIEIVLSDLDETLRTLDYSPIYSALGIPAWNAEKKRRMRDVVKNTLICMWTEILIEKHPEHAEPTYYYAQLSDRAKQAWKHFKNREYGRRCRALYETSREGAPDLTNIAQLIISESGLTKKTKTSEGYDDAEQKIREYLKDIYDHLNDALTEIDLTTAEERFRELAVGKLGLRRID